MDFRDQNTIEKMFPNLKAGKYKISSPKDKRYNCIAFAVGDTDKWWDPDPLRNYYWPSNILREYTIRAFKELFQNLGYSECKNAKLESNFEKVALFIKSGIPTHTAKQINSGQWVSKIADHVDIEHPLESLNEGFYGNVGHIFKKPI